MQRRSFLRNASLGAIAISAYGFISFDGIKYVGDCETTTDILGPFYRPGSPLRNDLLIPGDAGTKVSLSGIIKHDDCVTPYKKAKIELWHCNSKGEYDNTTDEFRYRATAYSDDNGNYSFSTILPVAYGIGNNNFRPAHFHMMITAENYQPLITQLYFVGDPQLSKDPSSSSPAAKRRILNVHSLPDKTKKVVFDVSLSTKLAPEISAIDKLAGVYKDEQNIHTFRFFKNNNGLWLKNKTFGYALEYIGNNTFRDIDVNGETFRFELMANGMVKMQHNISGRAVATAFK